MKVIEIKQNQNTGITYRLIKSGGRYSVQDNRGTDGSYACNIENIFPSEGAARERFVHLTMAD